MGKWFEIKYTEVDYDNHENDRLVTTWKEFSDWTDPQSGHVITAKDWALDCAYGMSDKHEHSVKEIPKNQVPQRVIDNMTLTID